MITTFLICALIFSFVLYHQNKKINYLIELSKDNKDQSEEQFKKETENKYLNLFNKEAQLLKERLKEEEENNKKLIESKNEEFKNQLQEKFEEAVQQIKFTEIEYKRTITKKRRQYNKENSHKAKPQKIWRYINEE